MNAVATRLRPWRRWQFAVIGVLLALLAGVAIGEWLGWPFLATPLQNLLSYTLERRVSFSTNTVPNVPNHNPSQVHAFQVRFAGGLRLRVQQLEIAAPAWSAAPHLLSASDVELDLRYTDLWHAYRGEHLRIRRLQAATLDATLERLADGRASWQFGRKPNPESVALPSFASFQVASGVLRYRDVPEDIDIEAHLSLRNSPIAHQSGSEAVTLEQPGSVLQGDANGYYRKQPLKVDMVSSSLLLSTPDHAQAVPVVLTFNATIGRATLAFKGNAADVLHPAGFSGSFTVKGPSLAAVGDMVDVTLPTTAEFQASGAVVKQGGTWHVRVNEATVGASRLHGVFVYETRRDVPLLSGRLDGTRLLLADLGPALGKLPSGAVTKGKGRVLPDRPFDLPALRKMDADVLIDISYVDLNTHFLEPLRPLRSHLQLADGVLRLSEIDALTAQGQLRGDLSLDGRGTLALWNADLHWDGVRIERWFHQVRADGAPPFVSGQMSGRVTLQGQGRSTAEILASLQGHVRTELHGGGVSHFAIEVAGLDLAQGLGVKIKGDDVLPVQCAVADLAAVGGVFRPRVMVLDTEDSAVWVDGSLSLATETLDLRTVVMPKDFSPLTLRSPLRVRGSFASPQVSLDKRPMGVKMATSFLLALVNPLAVLIPLIDSGANADAKRAAASCRDVMQRSRVKPASTVTRHAIAVTER